MKEERRGAGGQTKSKLLKKFKKRKFKNVGF